MFLILCVFLIAYFSSTYVSWCVCLEFYWHYVDAFNLFCWFEPLFCHMCTVFHDFFGFLPVTLLMPSASRHFDLWSFQQSLVTRGHQSGFSSWSCCALLEVKLFWILYAFFLLEWMASCFWIHLLSDPYFGNDGLRRKRLSFTGPMWYDMSAWPLSPKGWKGKTKVNFTKMFFPLWCCGCCFMRFLDMWIPLIIFFEGYNTVSFAGVSFKSRILGDIHLTLTMYSPIEPRYEPPFMW